MPAKFDFNTFLKYKNDLRWQRITTWKPGVGGVRHLIWKGFLLREGKINAIPSFFAFVNLNDTNGMVGISLTINAKFDPQGKGQEIIDKEIIGKRREISNEMLIDILNEKYGIANNEADFSINPLSINTQYDPLKHTFIVREDIISRTTLYNKAESKMALLMLRKLTNDDGVYYQVSALVCPISQALNSNKIKDNPPQADIKSGMSDFSSLKRIFISEGFTDEMFIPDGASSENWDFELGVSKEDAKKVRDSFAKAEQQSTKNYSGYENSNIFGSFKSMFTKTSQMNAAISDYYKGPMPDPDQLDSFVGTPGVDASQIRSIFGGVDESISLVNQFDSSLLSDVAFIYNFSGGGAYGVYMSALDEEIKNAKLKKILKKNGYQIQDQQNGAFYATHENKTSEQIDSEIAALRQQVGNGGATTFGIDMNKVVGAAKADAADANITDQNDQRLLGILHLGATMVHEAIHSKGSPTEGPSEQGEAKFMAWAMPIINEQRRKSYESQNRLDEYSPLIVDHSQRRMASAKNWMERAEGEGVVKTAQYGAQFLHNQNFTSHTGPAQWAASFWNYGTGAIESMLDQARPYQKNVSKISFEGQLRAQNKDKWISYVDTGEILENLLDPVRDPLVAYKTTEKLIEDGREKPLMLPIKSQTGLKRKASYDKGKEAFGYMSNLDLPMEDRVQKYDKNDEETTWFDRKFIANQVRYNPEYGNPLSKENEIFMWWVDPNGGPSLLNDPGEEHSSLKTSPWPKVASVESNASIELLTSFLTAASRGIEHKWIRGTRLVCPSRCVPLVDDFFKNKNISIYDFGEDGDSKIWIVDNSIDKPMINAAESYVRGDTEDDNACQAFKYITSISRVRNEGISLMIETVQNAVREAGIDNMLILGDLPLTIKTGDSWDFVRTVDFCSIDPDICTKIGEIVCDKLGAICDPPEPDTGTIVAHWHCVTFRFMGNCDCEMLKNYLSVESSDESIALNLYGRLLTPLMLAMDVLNENIIDPSENAMSDVEAKVVKTIISANEAININPLIIIDAIFLASCFGFSIDSELAEAAVQSEHLDIDAKAVWKAVRASGKGKSIATAEEYGIKDVLLKLMGDK